MLSGHMKVGQIWPFGYLDCTIAVIKAGEQMATIAA